MMMAHVRSVRCFCGGWELRGRGLASSSASPSASASAAIHARGLYRELLLLARARPTAASAEHDARSFVRRLARQGAYIDVSDAEALRAYTMHALDALTKRVAFERSMVPLWRRPRRRHSETRRHDGGGSCDDNDNDTDSLEEGRGSNTTTTTTFVVDRRTGSIVEENEARARARGAGRRTDCKSTRFGSMAEARAEHARLLRRQYFGRDPAPGWKERF